MIKRLLLIVISCVSLQVMAMPGDELNLAHSVRFLSYELSILPDSALPECDQLKSTRPEYGLVNLDFAPELLTHCRQALDAAIARLRTPPAEQWDKPTLAALYEWRGMLAFRKKSASADQWLALAMAGEANFSQAMALYQQEPIPSARVMLIGSAFVAKEFFNVDEKGKPARANLDQFLALLATTIDDPVRQQRRNALKRTALLAAFKAKQFRIWDKDDFTRDQNALDRVDILAAQFEQTDDGEEKMTLGLLLYSYAASPLVQQKQTEQATPLQWLTTLRALQGQKPGFLTLWLELKQLEAKKHTVFTYQSPAYQALWAQIGQLEKKARDIDAVLVDVKQLQYELLNQFHLFEQAAVALQSVLEISSNHLQTTGVEQTFWASRSVLVIPKLIDLLIAQERWSELEPLLKQWRTKSQDAANNLGALYIKQQRFDLAIKTLSAQDANLPVMLEQIRRLNLAMAYAGKSAYAKALSVLDNWVEPDKHFIYQYYLTLLAMNGRIEQAKQLSQQFAGAPSLRTAGENAALQSINAMDKVQAQPQRLTLEISNQPEPVFHQTAQIFYESDWAINGVPTLMTTVRSDGGNSKPVLVAGEAKTRGRLTFFQVDVTNDGKFLANASGNTITLWNLSSGFPVRRIVASGQVNHLQFVNHDQWLLGTSGASIASSSLTFWDIKTGKVLDNKAIDDSSWIDPIYLPTTNQIIYEALGKLVIADIADLTQAKAFTFDRHISALVVDEKNARLFISFNNRSTLNAPVKPLNSQIGVYTLTDMQQIGDWVAVQGKVEQMLYLPAQDKLLIETYYTPNPWAQFSQNNVRLLRQFSVEPTLMPLTTMPLNELVGELQTDGTHILVNTTSQGQKCLNTALNQLEDCPYGVEIFKFSNNHTIALQYEHDLFQGRDILHVRSTEDETRFSSITPFAHAARTAYFDEKRGYLAVTTDNLSHIWNMENGQETHRWRDRHPVFFESALSFTSELQQTPDGKHFVDVLTPENGQVKQQTIDVPAAENSGFSRYSVAAELISSVDDQAYMMLTNGYTGSAAEFRLARVVALQAKTLLPWTLKGERLVAVSAQEKLLFTQQDDQFLILRDLATADEIRQISIKNDNGGRESLRTVYFDPEYQKIWLTTYQKLVALDLTGQILHTYDNRWGTLAASGFSKDAANLVLAYDMTGSTLLRFIDRSNGQVVYSQTMSDRVVQGLAFSAQQQYLLVIREDGGVEIVDIQQQQSLATLFALPAQPEAVNWLVVDDAGRYDASNPGDIPGIAWRLPQSPLTPFPIEVFMREFYEPRLLPRLMHGGHFQPIPDLTQINISQPAVTITDIQPGDTPETVNVQVQIALERRDQRVFDLRLLRNHRQVAAFPEDHGEIKTHAGKAHIVLRNIALPPTKADGSIHFSAMVFNADGVKSRTAHIDYQPKVMIPEGERQAYVLSVGINHHTNPAWDLNYAVNDAQAMQSQIKQVLLASGDYTQVHPFLLVSAQDHWVTIDAIATTLRALAKRITPRDTLILTWSGHGYADETGAFHLFTSEVGQGSVRAVLPKVLANSLKARDLSRWLEKIDAGQITVVIDACNSAASVSGQAFKPGPMSSRGFGQLAWFKGMQVLTASQADDVALESDALQHGLLTYALLNEGLKHFAADTQPIDHQITSSEWLLYGKNRVPELFSALRNNRLNDILLDRGLNKVSAVKGKVVEPQLPGLFDFSRRKTTVLAREKQH